MPPTLERDHYATLDIPPDATDAQIKAAYHKLAKLLHPDKNKNSVTATGEFQKLQKASEVLLNPEKRKDYDAQEGYNKGASKQRNTNPGPQQQATGPTDKETQEAEYESNEALYRTLSVLNLAKQEFQRALRCLLDWEKHLKRALSETRKMREWSGLAGVGEVRMGDGEALLASLEAMRDNLTYLGRDMADFVKVVEKRAPEI